MSTGIEWTDETWNPVTGCTEVSPGCDGCYAKDIARRFAGTKAFPQGFDVTLRPERLDQPLKWRKPKRVFVNSMSDLFHQDVPDEYIARVFAVMAATPQHTYQILTKRHGRLRALLSSPEWCNEVWLGVSVLPVEWVPSQTWPLPNVWLGVSVEDQQRADLRIPALLETPAAVRFLSCEPLLGPVDLRRWLGEATASQATAEIAVAHGIDSREYADQLRHYFKDRCKPILDWVIVGGESGPKSRPMHPDWARSLRDQCTAAGVPFFFKQTGSVLSSEWSLTARKGNNPQEWPESFPQEFPA